MELLMDHEPRAEAGEPTPCNQSELIKAVDAGATCFWVPSPKCPRCGSTLVSNGRDVWCSFVGGHGEKACSYGLDTSVTIESI